MLTIGIVRIIWRNATGVERVCVDVNWTRGANLATLRVLEAVVRVLFEAPINKV